MVVGHDRRLWSVENLQSEGKTMRQNVKNWVLIDVYHLAYRAFHGKGGGLRELDNGIIFGILSDVTRIAQNFGWRICWCWEYGPPRRLELFRDYKKTRKAKRKELSEHEQEQLADMKSQVEELRDGILPSMGFANSFKCRGYEADDIIASLCDTIPKRGKRRCVIVSGDEDMFQLLTPDVVIWNVTKLERYTHLDFREQWGLEPSQWADVKAIAGCKSDDIPGVDGVGEKIAAQFLRGELEATTSTGNPRKSYVNISTFNWNQNLDLVQLPFAGTPVFTKQKDTVTGTSWDIVVSELGMESLIGKGPN